MVSLTNMTLNKVVLPAGESVHQDAKGQPMPPQRWPTEFHYVDGGLEQADATDFVCVNRVIAEPWRQCFAVSPVNIGESGDLLTEEELYLVQGYMDQPFHDWGSQREGKGQDKAWWEVDSIQRGGLQSLQWYRDSNLIQVYRYTGIQGLQIVYRGLQVGIQVRRSTQSLRKVYRYHTCALKQEAETQQTNSEARKSKPRQRGAFCSSAFNGKIAPPPLPPQRLWRAKARNFSDSFWDHFGH